MATPCAKKQDLDDDTPPARKSKKEEWAVVDEASRQNWRVRTGTKSKSFSYKDQDETGKATQYKAAYQYLESFREKPY